MKKYNVSDRRFYEIWLHNRRKAKADNPHAVNIVSQEQLDYCIRLMKELHPDAGVWYHPSWKFPAHIRWSASGYDGDILVSNASGLHNEQQMEFGDLFGEASAIATTVSHGTESPSVVSKRLDGHVITL